MRLIKALLMSTAAAVVLAGLVGSATATRLSTTSQRWKATYSRVEWVGTFGTTTCALTVEGSFHSRTSAKTLNTLTGWVTEATVSTPCIRGSATILRETLPWHIVYEGFEGTLPNITGIRLGIIGSSWRINDPVVGVTCLARTTAVEHVTVQETRERFTGRITESSMRGSIPTGPECFLVRGSITGTTTAVTNGSGAGISITLI
jgi:hypothetical protein